MDIRRVALNLVHESRTNPRRRFSQDELEDMAASIRKVGIIHPPVAREKGGEYELVVGSRRFRGARIAGLDEIDLDVRVLSDNEAREMQIIENLQRVDVHPLDEAVGYRDLMVDLGYDAAAVGEKVGKSESYVRRRLKLNDLIEKGQKLFLENKITAGHANLLSRLTEADQLEGIEYIFDTYDEPCSPVMLKGWIEEHVHLRLKDAPFNLADATLIATAAGCETCPKRTGASPLLFQDVESADTCTDRACFLRKVDAHVERACDALAAKGPLFRVSERYGQHGIGEERVARLKRDGVLFQAAWVVAKRKDTCAVKAVVVDGHGFKSFGLLRHICIDKTCKSHWPFENAGKVPEAKKLEKKVVRKATSAVVQAVLKAAVWPLQRPLLEYVVDYHVSYRAKKAYEALGIALDASNRPRRKLTDEELVKVLAASALLDEHKYVESSGAMRKELRKLAGELEVDVSAVERGLRDDVRRSKAAKSKKAMPAAESADEQSEKKLPVIRRKAKAAKKTEPVKA